MGVTPTLLSGKVIATLLANQWGIAILQNLISDAIAFTIGLCFRKKEMMFMIILLLVAVFPEKADQQCEA
ncbi:MAG: hypothetical protein JWN30_1280 [Bacilli bacterium]|nr:hypothetical protein [Bacilli bacterium]